MKLVPRIASPDNEIASPNHMVPAVSFRSQNAKWKKLNPTVPRNTRIAVAARKTSGE